MSKPISKLQSELQSLGLVKDPIQKEIIKKSKSYLWKGKSDPQLLYDLAKKCLKDKNFMEECSKRKDDISKMILENYIYDLRRYEHYKEDVKMKIAYSVILKEFLDSDVDYSKWGYQAHMLYNALDKNLIAIRVIITFPDLNKTIY